MEKNIKYIYSADKEVSKERKDLGVNILDSNSETNNSAKRKKNLKRIFEDNFNSNTSEFYRTIFNIHFFLRLLPLKY